MTLDNAKADQWTALVLFALGLAMLVGGYTMDRLEIRQIHPASIPGLVPMILGGAMMLCSSLLYFSARAKNAAAAGSADQQGSSSSGTAEGSLKNLGFAAFYSVAYALLLVGTLPFWLATAIFIAVFYFHFSWRSDANTRAKSISAALAISFGLVGAFAIATLFQEGFLVRLP
ncbi:MAG: tripartite tricarboxylate transporter TctB family protein [Pseudomonadota bacterium]